MRKNSKKPTSIELLINRYKEIFRIPENLFYYKKEDYRLAERKFLKWALEGEESNQKQLSKLLKQ